MLGVQIDSRLRYDHHVRQVLQDMPMAERALTRLSGSTWGVKRPLARRLYKSIILPKMLYGAQVWYNPPNIEKGGRVRRRRLEMVQNRCLRRITGAYKATKVDVLQSEAQVPPLELYMNKLCFDHYTRTKDRASNGVIDRVYSRIRHRLRARRERPRPVAKTSRRQKAIWTAETAQMVRKDNWTDEYIRKEWAKRWEIF